VTVFSSARPLSIFQLPLGLLPVATIFSRLTQCKLPHCAVALLLRAYHLVRSAYLHFLGQDFERDERAIICAVSSVVWIV
jgi:hypothetical protein